MSPTMITPELIECYVRDFMHTYVVSGKEDNARKQLATICEMFTIHAMQSRAGEMMEEIVSRSLQR